MKTVRVSIGDDVIEYDVDMPAAYGADTILLERDDDLLAGTEFGDSGFTVAPFLAPGDHATLVEGVRHLLHAAFANVVGAELGAEIALEDYHRAVSDEQHARLVRSTGLHWPNEQLPIPMALIERRVSEILGFEVLAINPNLGEQHFQLRVVRPGKPDHNPPHRDVWLDRLRNGANAYVPLAGSDESSSLPLVPGSHRWPESDVERTLGGARVGGIDYTVPAVTGARRPFRMIRPVVRANEIMVFTPYAIHGGGANRNPDRTRVSLELRFWRSV